ncbi:MAG TPA: acyltransferase [Kamptonema sp.]|nr:acyltransferase [Kamptonema sp.]
MKTIFKSYFKKVYDLSLGRIMYFMIKRYIKKDLLFTHIVYGDESRLHIASTAVVNNAVFNTISGEITIGEYVFFGHNVTIVTGTHDYHKFGRERQVVVPGSGRDVIIKEGAWLATNVTIIGPCIIGEHSVVAACSLVNKDVPPYSIVAGIPAKVIKEITPPSPTDKTVN